MAPPASLHEETTGPEPLDHPAKSFAEAALEPPSESNRLPNNPPGWAGSKYSAVQSPGEYVGAGILDAPTSPTRGHKRLSSRSSNRSLNGIKSPQKKRSSEEEKSDNVVYEKHSAGNGGQLTSVKQTEDHEKNLKQTEKEAKPKTNETSSPTKGEQELELTSGRVASAGWEKSGYVRFDSYTARSNANILITVFALHLSMSLSNAVFRRAPYSSTHYQSPLPLAGSSGSAPFHSFGLSSSHISSTSCFPKLAHQANLAIAQNGYVDKRSGPSSHPTSQPAYIEQPNSSQRENTFSAITHTESSPTAPSQHSQPKPLDSLNYSQASRTPC
jgi:hypothetical protein